MPAMREYIHLQLSLPANPYHQTQEKTSASKAAFSGKIHQFCVDPRYSNNVRFGGHRLCVCVPCAAAAEFISRTKIQVGSDHS